MDRRIGVPEVMGALCWVCGETEVVYRFLLANDVGTGWALLYEEFANVLEQSGR
jgi:hypothetical protein